MGLIAIGVDVALGGGFARVVADLDEHLTILDAVTTYDLQRTEDMIGLITTMAQAYKPGLVIVEYDGLQKGLGTDDRMQALATMCGFRIQGHITRGEKADPVFGVASMDQSFKKGEIRIPYGDQQTQDRMSALLTQLRAWRPDIKTKNLTQDLVMALWFVWKHWMKVRQVHAAPLQPQWRPSWITAGLGEEARVRGARLAG